MSWPLSHDFNEAVQNPKVAFADPDLKAAEPVVGAQGLPLPRSGNFADVYQMRGADGRDWAVKCFTRPVVGLADRYARVSDALADANLPFAVGFTFLAEGVRVGGVWRPVVKMEWVEGLLLNQVVRENAGKPTVLAALGQMWVRLCKRLREAGVAHADIQHGNVLLVPGARAGAFGLKLIDYDGMFVPALANTPSGEDGHPSFQHPARAATRAYSPDVDRFPHLVVATALAALEDGGPALWGRYDNGDNLLFTEADFRAPAKSPLFRELWESKNPKVRALAGRLIVACGRPVPQSPWLDEVAPDGDPAPLDAAGTRAAAAVMDSPDAPPPPAPKPPAREEPPARTVAPPKLASKERPALPPTRLPEPPRTPKIEPRRRPPARTSAAWPLLAVSAAVLCVAAVGAAVVFWPKSKPIETVQPKDDDGPPAPRETTPPKVTPPKVTPVPKPKDPVAIPKLKEKEPDPPPPKDPPPAPEPVALKPRWRTLADTDGAPAVVHADASAVLVGGPRAALLTFDPMSGAKLPAAVWLPVSRGDGFCPLTPGKVAWCAPNDTEVRTWDAKTGKLADRITVPKLPPGAEGANDVLLRPSPDARFLVVARSALVPGEYAEAPFRVFESKNEKGDKAVVTDQWASGSAHFTADSARVLAAEYSGRFRWFDLAAGKADDAWDYGAPGEGRAHRVTGISANGRVIGYTGPAKSATDTGPCLVDGRTGAVLHRFGKGYAADSPVAVSANGRAAAVLKESDDDAVIDVVGVPKGEALGRATLKTGGAVPTFALSADGRALLVHDPKAGTLRRLDLP